MGNFKSKLTLQKYPNCECIDHARSGAYYYNKKRCMSFEGHYCICCIQYNEHNYNTHINIYNYKYCQAESGHMCICDIENHNLTKRIDIKLCRAKEHKCRCLNHKRCNASKHICICTCICMRIGNSIIGLYDGCKAANHRCICLPYGPNYCRAQNNHPCCCEVNFKNVDREEHLGNCKAISGHPCICAFDKSKCQACY